MKAVSPRIAAAARDVPNTETANDSGVARTRAALVAIEHRHATAKASAEGRRTELAAFDARKAELEQQVRDLESGRAQMAVKIVRGAAPDVDDENAVAAITRLRRQQELLVMARRSVESELTTANAQLGSEVRRSVDAAEAMQSTIWEAKLRIAETKV